MTTSESSGAEARVYNILNPDDFIVAGDIENGKAIASHIENYIGKIESTLDAIENDHVHILIYWVKPAEDRPFHTIITSGMSDKPMLVPKGLEEHQYAELCLLLPKEWPVETLVHHDDNNFENEHHYWPMRWLKMIAGFPHKNETWIGNGHTIPNGEDADNFADNTRLGCILLLPSFSLGGDFFTLKRAEDKTIRFYCMYPIYREEMNFKLEKGSDALVEKFEKNNIRDIVDIKRVNTCRKKGLFGWW